MIKVAVAKLTKTLLTDAYSCLVLAALPVIHRRRGRFERHAFRIYDVPDEVHLQTMHD